MKRNGDGLLVATFLLGDAVFGIDAHQVQEVSRVGEITPVHQAPPDVIGIRNLRGRIVTVVDLRARLGLGKVRSSPDNRVLIVDLNSEPIGLLVDSISDTISAAAEQVVPPPPNLHGIQSEKLVGVCRGGERLVALLDLNSVMHLEEHAGAALPEKVNA